MDNASGWTAMGTFWVAVVAAVATTITAVLAWCAARSMANVERDRWHRELTPVFTITVEWPNGVDTDWLRMRLRLDGPTGLDGHDSVQVSIRDTPGDRVSGLAGSAGADEVAQVI